MVLLMSACNKKYGHDLLLTVENARMEKVCQYDLDMILKKTLTFLCKEISRKQTYKYSVNQPAHDKSPCMHFLLEKTKGLNGGTVRYI